MRRALLLLAAALLLAALLVPATQGSRLPGARGCPVFPKNNHWNKRVDRLPLHPNSDAIVRSIGVGETMPAQIFRQLSEAGALLRSALIGLGVILFVLTIAVNMGARKAVVVVDRRVKGTA